MYIHCLGDNKKDIMFLLVWDKDSYTERFLTLLLCTCVLKPTLVHLCQTSQQKVLRTQITLGRGRKWERLRHEML
jgi:hypothetical protein